MVVWRLTAARHAATAFSGEGAAAYPGRWNHRGRRVVYTSDSPALAALEILANAETASVLRGRVLIRAVVPDDQVVELQEVRLPEWWDANPIGTATRDLGEAWRAEGAALALAVPSAVMPLQRNVLLNPEHPAFRAVEVGEPIPLRFDPRLSAFDTE